jgi:PTH1 family peptidyl-tRNA hydrolase
MNLSGKAVKYWMQQENIPIEQLLIISDDKDLQFGALRMKAKGSGGTHNGLNNIIETIESSDFSRLRFGIGNEFPAGQQIEFVLGTWSPEEQTLLAERTKTAVEIIKSFVVAGVTQTMSRYNNK